MLGDNIRAELPEMQRQAESMMVTRCEIRSGTDEWRHNPDSGKDERVPAEVIYTGKCRLRVDLSPTEDETGAQQLTTQRYAGTLPLDAEPPRVGYLLTVLDNPDPYLVGRTLSIVAVGGGSLVYQRRFTALDNLG